MNKKVRATICVVVLLWVVAFVQIGMTKFLYKDGKISYAFVRNQLVVDDIKTELKVNLGDKTVNVPVWKETFGRDTLIKVTNVGDEHFLHIEMEGNRKEELKNFLHKNGFDEYDLYTQTACHSNGKLSDVKKEQIVRQILKECGAYEVRTVSTEDWYSVYGYTAGEEEAVNVNGRRVNVNVAITYDEEKGENHIYVGSPLLSLDY